MSLVHAGSRGQTFPRSLFPVRPDGTGIAHESAGPRPPCAIESLHAAPLFYASALATHQEKGRGQAWRAAPRPEMWSLKVAGTLCGSTSANPGRRAET